MDDLLDLFGDRSKAGEEKNSNQAPVELMTQFLLLISERKMSEALALTSEILEFEPHNAMILEYKRSLAIYIQQAKGKFKVYLLIIHYSSLKKWRIEKLFSLS